MEDKAMDKGSTDLLERKTEMNRTTFTFPSTGKDQLKIVATKWEPEVPARAVVQIAHGMAEHMARYDSFARFLGERGFAVYGNDHRGHGQTAAEGIRGWFAEENGFELVVQDLVQLTQIIRREQPELPVFLFGHSMGSFLVRRTIQLDGEELQGVILCGTGSDPGLLGKLGLALAKREVRRKGGRALSPTLAKLTLGNFNRNFRPQRTRYDWLSRDEREVDRYIADPLCGGVFTAGFYADLLTGLITIHRRENIQKTPVDLPVLLIAGDQDPVGDYGKGVQQVYEMYRRVGLEDITCRLYPEGRHEILNELNKEEVYKEIADWLEKRV